MLPCQYPQRYRDVGRDKATPSTWNVWPRLLIWRLSSRQSELGHVPVKVLERKPMTDADPTELVQTSKIVVAAVFICEEGGVPRYVIPNGRPCGNVILVSQDEMWPPAYLPSISTSPSSTIPSLRQAIASRNFTSSTQAVLYWTPISRES